MIRSILTTTTILALLFTLRAAATDTIIYVSPTGETYGDGTLAHPHTSVQRAIDEALSNGWETTVVLLPGNHVCAGTVTLPSRLISLRGQSPETTILKADMVLLDDETAISELEVQAVLSNPVPAFLSNVRLMKEPTCPDKVTGLWRDAANTLRIQGISEPSLPGDGVSLSYLRAAITNAMATVSTGSTARLSGSRNGRMAPGDGWVDEAGDRMTGKLDFSSMGESPSTNLALQQVGTAGVIWFATNGALCIKTGSVGGTGDRFAVQNAMIYAYRQIDMRGRTVTNMASPNAASEAATKGYVDNRIDNISLTGDFHVGSASTANHLIMENDSSFIMTRSGSGNNLRLMADHANGGQIVMHSPVSMPGMAGRVSGVTVSGGYTVSNSYCRETSTVIVTPQGTIPFPVSVVPAENAFAVYGATNVPCTFNYIILHP